MSKLSCLEYLNNSYNIAIITGERPYKCHLPECGRAFIQLSNLQQHLRNHDAQVERAKNRPFHCNICGKGFATESSLRTHTSKVRRVSNFKNIAAPVASNPSNRSISTHYINGQMDKFDELSAGDFCTTFVFLLALASPSCMFQLFSNLLNISHLPATN